MIIRLKLISYHNAISSTSNTIIIIKKYYYVLDQLDI